MECYIYVFGTVNTRFVNPSLKELEDPKLYTYICNHMNIKRGGSKKAKEKSLMRRFRGSSLITQSDVFTDNTLAASRSIYNGQYDCNFNVRHDR